MHKVTHIAQHAIRKQEAYEERRRCRIAAVLRSAAVATGYSCDPALFRFLVKVVELLPLDPDPK